MEFREASKFGDVLLYLEDVGLLSEVFVFNMVSKPYVSVARFNVNWDHKLFDSVEKKRNYDGEKSVLMESDNPTRAYSLGEIEAGEYLQYDVPNIDNRKFNIKYKKHLLKIIKEHIFKYNYVYAVDIDISDAVDCKNLGVGFDIYIKVKYINNDMCIYNYNIFNEILKNNSKYPISYICEYVCDGDVYTSCEDVVFDGNYNLKNKNILEFKVSIILEMSNVGSKIERMFGDVSIFFNGYYYIITLIYDHLGGNMRSFRYERAIGVDDNVHDKLKESIILLEKHIGIVKDLNLLYGN